MKYLEKMVDAGRAITSGNSLFHSYGTCLRTNSTDDKKMDVVDQYPFYISFESSSIDWYVTIFFSRGSYSRRQLWCT